MASWFIAQVSLVIAAVLLVGRGRARLVATFLLVGASGLLPWFAPPRPKARVLLCFMFLVTVIKTLQIGWTHGPWPAWRRVWHGLMPFDVRGARVVEPAVDWSIFGMTALYCALGALSFAALSALPRLPWVLQGLARYFCGVVFVFALVGASSDFVRLGHRAFGVAVPPIQRSPLLARSVAEFWAVRWNRPWSEWLRRFAFIPLARRHHSALAVLVAFTVSGVMHGLLVLPALDAGAAATMAGFFLAQGLVVLAESPLRVREWPTTASHAWTMAVLLLTSPLFVVPFLRVLGY